jgi:cytochrome c oxidase subunit II
LGYVALALAGAQLLAVACSEPEAPAPPPTEVAAPHEPPAGMDQVQWGEWLFVEHGCTACHHINGVRGVGGALNNIAGTDRPLQDGTTVPADEAYLRRSILDPGAQVVEGFDPTMPSYEGILNDAQVDALVTYLQSLSPH